MSKKIRYKQADNITPSQESQLDDISNKNIEKATKTWKLVLTACSLVGMGFTAGIYLGYNNSKIEYQDKVNEYREHIIEMGREQEKEIHNYNHEISKLLDENNSLKHQIRQLKSKRK